MNGMGTAVGLCGEPTEVCASTTDSAEVFDILSGRVMCLLGWSSDGGGSGALRVDDTDQTAQAWSRREMRRRTRKSRLVW